MVETLRVHVSPELEAHPSRMFSQCLGLLSMFRIVLSLFLKLDLSSRLERPEARPLLLQTGEMCPGRPQLWHLALRNLRLCCLCHSENTQERLLVTTWRLPSGL